MVTQKTMMGIKDKKEAYLKIVELSNENLKLLSRALDWNYMNKVKFFRIWSDIFPHMSNRNLENFVGAEKAKEYRSMKPFEKTINNIG